MNLFISLLSLLVLNCSTYAQNEETIREGIVSLAKDIESKQKSTKKDKIAILQFRTSSNSLTRFNHFIQDQLYDAYSESKKFEVLDQSAVNMVLESTNWNLEMSESFRNYTELSDLIFRNTGEVPDGFIFGLIEDNEETFTLTFYYYPNGLVRSSISSAQTFSSSDFSNKLLGKFN